MTAPNSIRVCRRCFKECECEAWEMQLENFICETCMSKIDFMFAWGLPDPSVFNNPRFQ